MDNIWIAPEYRQLLGVLAFGVGVLGYYPYLRDILRGKTTPHLYTYFIQALMGGMIVVAQLLNGAGWGALASAVPALFGVAVVGASVWKKRGHRTITDRDRMCFQAALMAIVIWIITEHALLAVLLVIFVNTVAFFPTWRKTREAPYSETLSSYQLGVARSFISLPALATFNLVTLLPPLCHIALNVPYILKTRAWRKVYRR